jgi:hypothetical protein
MTSAPQAGPRKDSPSGSTDRHPSLLILFLHSHIADVERCVQEPKTVQFTVNTETVVTSEEFAQRPSSHDCDLGIAEYPSPNFEETNALELLHQSKRQIPLIIASSTLQRNTERRTEMSHARRAVSIQSQPLGGNKHQCTQPETVAIQCSFLLS